MRDIEHGVLKISDRSYTVSIERLEQSFNSFGKTAICLSGNILNVDRAFSLNMPALECFKFTNPTIKRVVFNDPATVVMWSDGTKTVVKCQPGDEYSRETGLAMCIAKKFFGNKGNFNEVFKKFIEDYDSPLDNGIPKVGTLIEIIDAGCGACGANRQIGRVTTKEHTSGMLSSDPGYNVELESGAVWRINPNAEIEILKRGR